MEYLIVLICIYMNANYKQTFYDCKNNIWIFFIDNKHELISQKCYFENVDHLINLLKL